ncbi:hypothetical protein N9O61_05200 [Octadecabacter sp.]|nr:hypothetical protein [Octadecabacter sp.]
MTELLASLAVLWGTFGTPLLFVAVADRRIVGLPVVLTRTFQWHFKTPKGVAA